MTNACGLHSMEAQLDRLRELYESACTISEQRRQEILRYKDELADTRVELAKKRRELEYVDDLLRTVGDENKQLRTAIQSARDRLTQRHYPCRASMAAEEILEAALKYGSGDPSV